MQQAKIKSYKYNDVIKKLKDGSWETNTDVVARRHLEVIDNETKKKMTIFVEGKLQEANYSVTYLTSGGKGTQGVKRVVRVTKTFISREQMMKWIDAAENDKIEGFIDIISTSENVKKESCELLTTEEITMINESLDSADKREYGSRLVRIKLRLKQIVAEIEDAGGFETDGNIFKVLDSRAKKLVSEYETLKAEEQRILNILHEK